MNLCDLIVCVSVHSAQLKGVFALRQVKVKPPGPFVCPAQLKGVFASRHQLRLKHPVLLAYRAYLHLMQQIFRHTRYNIENPLATIYDNWDNKSRPMNSPPP